MLYVPFKLGFRTLIHRARHKKIESPLKIFILLSQPVAKTSNQSLKFADSFFTPCLA
jgi:hypothetical protein